MVRPDLRQRVCTLYFATDEELIWWKAAASENNASLCRYILEMARRGREGEAARPLDQTRELEKMKEELARLRISEGELRKLYEATEGELFRLRHSSYAAPPNGHQEPSERLVDALQGAARPMSNQELLRSLNVDVRDIEAMKLLLGQLQALRDIGLLEETPMGWKWKG